MKRLGLICVFACMASASSAAAQDAGQIAGVLAAGVEGLGQSLGEAATGESSVFVTASGHAALPAPIAEAYLINIEGQSSSAVEASRLHDDRLKAAQDIAARFKVAVDIGATSFVREADQAAQSRRNAQMQAAMQAQAQAGHPGVFPPGLGQQGEGDRVFVVRTGVRFKASSAEQFPAFLDALKAAGIDNLSGALGVPKANMFASNEVLGFGRLAKVDDAIWDRAMQDAMASARRQAAVLAATSGRDLGEARQILLLSRSVQSDEVDVTVAVRYGFAPAK